MAKSKYSYRNTTYKASSSKKSYSSKRYKKKTVGIYTDFRAVGDLLQRAENALDSEVLPAMAEAYDRAMTIPKQEIRDWFLITHHRDHAGRHVSDSWIEGKVSYSKGKAMIYIFGYDRNKGGLTVIFFEYGTPKIDPEFKMYYAMKNNELDVSNAFVAALADILKQKGLMD